MKVLLDTYMIIWSLTDNPKLPKKAKDLILQPYNDTYYSVVSLWEIEIKHLIKPDRLPVTAKKFPVIAKKPDLI